MPRHANRLFPRQLPPLRAVIVATALVFHAASNAASADDWPQFRGPNRDGAWSEAGVLQSLPADGVKVRWRKPVGPGWSSPVVSRGRVFVTDVQLVTNQTQERIHCFDTATGESRWSYSYDAEYPDFARTVEHASPPTATPIVEQDRVYFTGGTGQVHCLQASTGKLLWEKQLATQYEISTLSCRASPLIEGDLLILVAGGKPGAYLVALDKNSGREVWHALDEAISNSSPIVITAAGTRQLIVWTSESVTALVPTSGELLWRERLLTSSNDGNAAPVARENRLLISGLMFELAADPPGAKALWPKSRAVARRVLSNTSTPLVRDDHVYSARSGGELVCLDARTGEQVWATDKVTALKSGASIHLVPNGEVTWLFTDEGNLILARLTPQGYEELGRAHLLEPTSFFGGKLLAWVPPAFANRHVFARNDKEIVCASLAAERPEPEGRQPSPMSESERAVRTIPTRISGTYRGGELVELRVRDRMAYMVKPTGALDAKRRWLWEFPFWLGINDGFGNLQHRNYVEQALAAGFHVAGVDVGPSCGSPAAADVCQAFHERLVADYGLNKRARIMGQSHGGLIAYGWAFRHPTCVERIAGICPATDFRSWPTLSNVVNFPVKGLDYGISLEELARRAAEFNPIDNLAPLAQAGVKILHIHGDKDELVPMSANSTELARRYRELGGDAKIVVIEGLGHGGQVLYQSEPLIEFLLGD